MRVGVAGAPGALGKEVVQVLEMSAWKPDEIVPLARAASTTAFVEYDGRQIAVDDLSEQAMEELDGIVLAVPGEVAREAAARAADEGIATIDCSGVLAAEGAPRVVPWLTPDRLVQWPDNGVVSLPSAGAMLIASVLAPLARAGIQGLAHVTLLVPASEAGRRGIDELSRQVVTLFNAGTAPRKVFPDGLAFDLLPQLGELGDDGLSGLEARVAAEVRDLIGLPVVVTAIRVPVFSGTSAAIVVHGARRTASELVERVLSDAGVELPEAPGSRYLPRPRRVEGDTRVSVGRIRYDPAGALHLWSAADNLRLGAVAAVGALGALLRAG